MRRIYLSHLTYAATQAQTERKSRRVDRNVERRRVASAHERLVELVADCVEDAERERGHVVRQRAHE